MTREEVIKREQERTERIIQSLLKGKRIHPNVVQKTQEVFEAGEPAVSALLLALVCQVEALWEDNKRLADRVAELESELERWRTLRKALRGLLHD